MPEKEQNYHQEKQMTVDCLNGPFLGTVLWCDTCAIPIISGEKQEKCPICRHSLRYLSTDLRPVFPEERLLLELLLKKEPFSLAKSSVWNAANRYYIDGKAISISSAVFRNADCEELRTKLLRFQKENVSLSQKHFDSIIQKFIRANKLRLEFIKDEAFRFVNETARNFIEKNGSDAENRIIVSFSGGKDSTATADIVVKALGNPYVTHLFGNTTLEFPTTFEYADRYRKSHPMAEFRVAQNTDQNFYEVCKEIGPPARMMRWCCSMFKTGPITRILRAYP